MHSETQCAELGAGATFSPTCFMLCCEGESLPASVKSGSRDEWAWVQYCH